MAGNKKEMTHQTKSLVLKISVINKVKAMAEKENRNFSNMVETILIKYIKEHGSR